MFDPIITWMMLSGMPIELAVIILIVVILSTMPLSLLAIIGVWLFN